ncbi:MAG: helix-turn-helix transcriptional regulator [Aureispira sp.]
MKISSLHLVEDGFLYLGKVPTTIAHQHYALQLTVSWGQKIEVNNVNQTLQATGVYIPSQVVHQLLGASPMVLLLAFPTSKVGHYYQQKYPCNTFQELPLSQKEGLANIGKQYYNKEGTKEEIQVAYHHWREACLPSEGMFQRMDKRIQEILVWLQEQSGPPISAAKAAQQIYLSTSRFLHLFRQETGVTYRRMQLWIKLIEAYQQLGEAGNLTELAYSAGFADSAHFSRTFKETFGLSPSLLF